MRDNFKVKDMLSINIHQLPQEVNLEGIQQSGNAPYERIISFVFSIDEMVQYLQRCIQDSNLVEQGYLFFVYPKKGNKKYEQFIHRDEIFPAIQVDEEKYIGDSDYKFVSLMSLDETFSVLSIKHDRKARGKKKSASSQCVSDYESMIPQLRTELAKDASDLAFYDGLTPGYQKDWARYIYSAKREETQKARLAEMRDITRLGFKTKALYRKSKSEGKI